MDVLAAGLGYSAARAEQVDFSHGSRLFRVSVSNNSSERRGRKSGKVYADVREIAESIRELVKFKDALHDAGSSEEDLDSSVPWWEQFPKRWVIVILCFSAFLLCNMDRVSLSLSYFSLLLLLEESTFC